MEGRAAAGACLSTGAGHRAGPGPWPEGARRRQVGPQGQRPAEP